MNKTEKNHPFKLISITCFVSKNKIHIISEKKNSTNNEKMRSEILPVVVVVGGACCGIEA